MNRWVRVLVGLAIVAAAAAWMLSARPGDAGQNGDETVCCFTNPAFAGVCRVTPSGDETCESILQYLNTPHSTGKGYCGNTTIRGGWQRVDCPDE